MVATTICPAHMNSIRTAPMDWSTRTLPLSNVRSMRPGEWNLDAEVTTAILRGVSAHKFVSTSGVASGEYLICVPRFLIIHRMNCLEIQRNYDNDNVDSGGWPDIPFSEVPGDIIYDLMLCYTQMGYAQ